MTIVVSYIEFQPMLLCDFEAFGARLNEPGIGHSINLRATQNFHIRNDVNVSSVSKNLLRFMPHGQETSNPMKIQ
jgi:hypothetical protein